MSDMLEWNRDRHSPGIAAMDGQHRAIVTLMDGLVQRDAARASKAELSKMLESLRQETVRHFKEIEAYMAATACPKLDIHQVIHRDLLVKLEEHVNRFQVEGERLGAGLLSFLKFWLAAHISGGDRHHYGQGPGECTRCASPRGPTAASPSARPARAGELR